MSSSPCAGIERAMKIMTELLPKAPGLWRNRRRPACARLAQAVALCVVLVSMVGASSPVEASQLVKVGLYQNKPLIFTGRDGKPQGLFVDILDSISRDEGFALKYVPGYWTQCLERLRRGEIDLLGPIAYSDKRAEEFDFTSENILTNWGVLCKPKKSSIESLLDLKGKKIALLKDDTYANSFRNLLNRFGIQAQFLFAHGYDEVFGAIETGEAQAGVANRLVALQPRSDLEIQTTPIIFGPRDTRIAAPKGSDRALIRALDKRLIALKRQPDSAYYLAIDRWLEVGRAPSRGIPYFLLFALGFACVLLLVFFALSVLLRSRVRAKTAALTQRNVELESEIAERIAAEAALRRSEEKFRALFEGSRDAITITGVDGRILDANNAAIELTGYGLEQLTSMSPEQFCEDPAERGANLSLRDESGAARDSEIRLRQSDGGERECLLSSSVWKNAKGDMLGFQTIIRDITNRKKVERDLQSAHDELEARVAERTAELTRINSKLKLEIAERNRVEEALRKSERHLRLVADNAPAYIAYVGKDDLRYYFVNQRFEDSFGIPRSDIIGKHVSEIIGDDNYQFAMPYLDRVRSGKPASYVNTFNVEQGKRWINVNFVPDFDDHGEVRGIVVLSHDISDLKRAEEVLTAKTHELRERIKELNCLYGISKITEKCDLGIDDALQKVVDLMAPSWQYPEITCARIALGQREYKSANFAEPVSRQCADIFVRGEKSGSVEVGYLEAKPPMDEGPFLKEERSLIDAVAEQMGILLDRMRTEDKLREKNEFLTNILESFSYPLYVINSDDYTIELTNSAASSDGVVCGVPCYVSTHNRDKPCDDPEHPCPLQEVKKSRRAMRVEHVHRDEGGSQKYLAIHAYPVLDSEGNVKQIIEYCLDVTEKKKIEEALKAAYHRLNQIIEFLPDPTLVIDDEGRIVAWNRAMAKLTDTPATEILGKGDYEHALPFYGERRPLLLDLALDWDESYADKYISVRRHDDGVLVSESYHPILKGGTYLSGTARTLRDADGKLVGAIESLRNISEVKLAENALKESERRLSQIIEFLPDATMVIDVEGKLIAWNQAMEDLTGVEASSVLGKGDHEYAIPFYGRRRPVMIDLVINYDEEIASRYLSVRKKEDRLLSETYFPDFHGRGATWLWNVAAPLYDQEGRIVGAIEVIRDVTDRKLAEEAVRESQEQFALFMDMLPHGVFIKDESGVVIYVNQYVRDLFDAGNWIGRDAYEAFPDHPEVAEAMMADDRRALVLGQVRNEESMPDKHGNERVFETTKFRISRGEKPPLLGGIGLDITDRVKARDALRSSQERYKALYKEAKETEELFHSLLDSTLDAIITYDLEGCVTYVNHGFTKAFGWLREEIADGAPYTPDSELEVTKRNVEMVIGKGNPLKDFETRRLTKYGDLVDVSISASRFNDHEGKPAGMLVILRDISERKQAEKELAEALETAEQLRDQAQEANRAKSAFVANISHEIRTPMNAIMGMTNLALRLGLDSKLRDYLGKILTSSQTLLGIINEVLDFSKIEAGKLDLESIDFDLRSVIRDMCDLVCASDACRNVEFLVSIAADVPCELVGDPLRLKQILTNLAGNAVKFTPLGEVAVTVELEELSQSKANLRFSVQDTGIGIPEDRIDKLFDSFTQADGSTTRRFGGSGLGLTISRRLVEIMGGAIRVESEPDKGSLFSFSLWFDMQPDSQRIFYSAPQDMQGMRVLIVDDNETSRTILSAMLKSFSFQPVTVSSGEEALKELIVGQSTEPYDLALLDWQMRGLDGIETAKRIDGAIGPSKVIPKIIMITAFGSDEVRVRAQEAGFNGFLTKPVQPSELLDTIMDLFGKAGPRLSKVARAKAREAIGAQRVRGARILIVEDNEINQQVASEILEYAGVKTEVVGNGKMALKALDASSFDGVLMDIQMPEMDGYEAARAIRSIERFQSLPIIAMTAHTMAGDREKCLGAGMNDHVAKPIESDSLLTVLAKWVKPSEQTSEAPRQSTRESYEGGESLSIPGIEVKDALRRIGGNWRMLLNLIFAFVEHHGNDARHIGEALDSNDIDEAKRAAHDLKGASGALSANRVYTTATELGDALRESDLDKARLLLNRLGNALAELNHSVKGLEIASEEEFHDSELTEESLPQEIENIAPLLKQFAGLLAAFDVKAVEMFHEIRPRLTALSGAEEVAELGRLVDSYDLRGSLDVLNRMADRLGVRLK